MASVTNIKVILNMSNYKVSIYDGENGETNYIDAGGRLDKSIWVPWIGTQDEAFKSLLLKTLDGIEYQCFIFQDYWRPPSVLSLIHI